MLITRGARKDLGIDLGMAEGIVLHDFSLTCSRSVTTLGADSVFDHLEKAACSLMRTASTKTNLCPGEMVS
jgi:hypothetical protein